MGGFNVGGFAGGLTSGLVMGTKLVNAQQDQKWQEEQRGRQRKEWEDEDAIGKAFSGSMSGSQPGVGLDVVRAQPAMSMDPNAPQGVPGVERPQMNAAPTNVPGLFPRAKSPLSEDDNMRRVLDASNAAMMEAGQRGNWKQFVKHFETAAGIRDNLRTKALDNAGRQFAMTGDWNSYVPAYNDFVADGNKIDGIQKAQDGSYVISATGTDGRQIQRPVKDDSAMKTLVMTMTDPAAMRKLEAQKAIKEFEILAEQSKAVATEEAKARAKAVYQPDTVKRSRGEGEGDDVGVVVPDGKGGASIQWQTGADAGPRPLPNKTANDVRSAVMGLYKISDMAGMDPTTQGKLGNAMTFASSLLQSNKGSDNAAILDVNTAARIGSDIAEGKLKENRYQDAHGRTWRGVEWQGKKLLLDLIPGEAAPGTPKPGSTVQSGTTGIGTRSVSGKIGGLEPKQQVSRLDTLPAGAKQIGTSGGKPVYQTPDGKKFIGE